LANDAAKREDAVSWHRAVQIIAKDVDVIVTHREAGPQQRFLGALR
jgi:hypothetical protein